MAFSPPPGQDTLTQELHCSKETYITLLETGMDLNYSSPKTMLFPFWSKCMCVWISSTCTCCLNYKQYQKEESNRRAVSLMNERSDWRYLRYLKIGHLCKVTLVKIVGLRSKESHTKTTLFFEKVCVWTDEFPQSTWTFDKPTSGF